MIAAIGKNNELGKNNSLIWDIKEDLKFFKDTTMGHPVVMGRNTFLSLPKVLPGRKNIVISDVDLINNKIEVYKSIKEFLTNYEKCKDELFIIGGASIYKQFIDLSNKLYLTEIDDTDKDADVYFPKFDKRKYKKTIVGNDSDNKIEYNFVIYERR